MNQLVEGLAGKEVIHDDFLIVGCGTTDEDAEIDHDKNLREFLDRARERNLRLNAEKMKMTEVPYIGHLLTREGRHVDPKKVEAIEKIPEPDDAKAVQRLLGLVNYLAKFAPHLSDILEPLRRPMDKGTEWCWLNIHQQAFDRMKKALTSTPVLQYYDVKKPVCIQCDASDGGLGAGLLQDGLPVVYASRALTATERNYAQIKKELLAIVFACEKFDQYVYVREKVTMKGWPPPKSDSDLDVRAYYNVRHDLTVHNGLVLKDCRIVVPTSLRKNTIATVHRLHQGIQGCIRLAKDAVYWPLINQEITDYVSQSSVCNMRRPEQCKEPMVPHVVPGRPWAKDGVDLFELQGQHCLLLVDYFSNFFELMRLSSSTRTKCVIGAMRSQFKVVMSDNGPQFSCGEFREFAQKWDFEHVTSSPRYHQSNGQVERAIGTVKNIVKKAMEDGSDVQLALLNFRNTLPGQNTWTLGECTKKLSNRSYVVLVQGHTYRRNRRHLRLVYENLPLPDSEPREMRANPPPLEAGPMSRTTPRAETRMPMSELLPNEEPMPITGYTICRYMIHHHHVWTRHQCAEAHARTRKPPAYLADQQ
ncbi:hypothetical protein NP493_283g06029 [Ridgeia piscesae]|uniref:Integrase catalytic domain-containing protein n=1 Tax=Ridgeia piscesae TaxID=27915 RepID=A0AAD9NX74_RIDPI|nr:hypothetical protein NP493_283g06029 [Ridgeia piscesae]